MPAFTPARRAIRKRAKEFAEQLHAAQAAYRAADKAVVDHRKTCPHVAMKHGHAGGMGWSDCPDCGFSSP